MGDKTRIELRIGSELLGLIDDVGEVVGLSRNSLFVLAGARLAAELAILYGHAPGVRRVEMFALLEKQVLRALEDVRKAL